MGAIKKGIQMTNYVLLNYIPAYNSIEIQDIESTKNNVYFIDENVVLMNYNYFIETIFTMDIINPSTEYAIHMFELISEYNNKKTYHNYCLGYSYLSKLKFGTFHIMEINLIFNYQYHFSNGIGFINIVSSNIYNIDFIDCTENNIEVLIPIVTLTKDEEMYLKLLQ